MARQHHEHLKEGLTTVQQAVEVRKEISALYKQYRSLSEAACLAARITRNDFKSAVDAIHYLGGGWPSENSKGRMERLLDNFVGMYRVLDFIGRGHLVRDHLKNLGVTVSLDPDFAITNTELSHNECLMLQGKFNIEYYGIEKPKDTRQLVRGLVDACEMLQTDICGKADLIKDNLRPKAQKHLGVEDEEYDRLFTIVRFSGGGASKPKKVQDVKVKTAESVSNFNRALGVVDKVTTSPTHRPWMV